MIEAETAVRARRRLTNKLIAAHEAARLAPFFLPGARVIAGDGSLIEGVEAIVAAFAAQFSVPGFDRFERTTAEVDVDSAGERAAESGAWTALTRTGPAAAGRYLAVWRKLRGQWAIESELFVTLSNSSPP